MRLLATTISLLVSIEYLSANSRFNTTGKDISSHQKTPREEISQILASIHIPAAWKDFLNPQSVEFWTEGNHIPDAGFILFLQDMTVESAKLWLIRGEIKARYLEKALELTEQAQKELIRDGLIKDRYNVVKNNSTQFKKTTVSPIGKNQQNLKDIQIFFIFSPTCPHCQALAKTLVGFPNVNPLQATKGSLYHWDGLQKSEIATQETLMGYAADGSVPVLVLHHIKRNEAIVLKGQRSTEEILLAASQLLGGAAK